MRGWILSADIGSTHLKVALCGPEGKLQRLQEERLPMLRDASGRAEHDAGKILARVAALCRAAAQGRAAEIRGLVLSTYNLSLLAIDKNFKPLSGVMTFMDTRPAETLPSLFRKLDPQRLYRRSGWPAIPHTPLAKLWWIKQRKPRLFKQAAYFTDIKGYVLAQLLGRPLLDWSSAGATQLFNLSKLAWDQATLKALGLDPKRLSQLVDPGKVAGTLGSGAAKLLGLRPGTAVVPGLYDAAALCAGAGALQRSDVAVLNLGTSAMLRCGGSKGIWHPDGLLQPVALAPGRLLNGGGVNNAGGALEWLAGVLGLSGAEAVLREAAKAPAGAAGILAQPSLAGERRPGAAGQSGASFSGLLSTHGRPEIARAWVEGIGSSLHRILDALENGGTRIREIRASGRGLRSKFWARQLAQSLGKPLRLAKSEHMGLIGNAALAWEALGKKGALGRLEDLWKGPAFSPRI